MTELPGAGVAVPHSAPGTRQPQSVTADLPEVGAAARTFVEVRELALAGAASGYDPIFPLELSRSGHLTGFRGHAGSTSDEQTPLVRDTSGNLVTAREERIEGRIKAPSFLQPLEDLVCLRGVIPRHDLMMADRGSHLRAFHKGILDRALRGSVARFAQRVDDEVEEVTGARLGLRGDVPEEAQEWEDLVWCDVGAYLAAGLPRIEERSDRREDAVVLFVVQFRSGHGVQDVGERVFHVPEPRESLEPATERLERWVPLEELAGRRRQFLEVLPIHLDQERLTCGEAPIEGSLPYSCCAGDGLHRRGVVSREGVTRDLNDPCAVLLRVCTENRIRWSRRSGHVSVRLLE